MLTMKKINKTDSSGSTEYLSETQIKKLLQYVSDKADMARQTGATRAVIDELIIYLLTECGLRPAELCNLNIEDLPSSSCGNTLIVRDSSGKINREIEVSPQAAQCMYRFKNLYRKSAMPTDALLINEQGRRFTYRSLYNKVKNIGVNAGIGTLYPNMLRGAFIVRLFNNVRDLRLVQQQAGHASYKTTALYVKSSLKNKQKQQTTERTNTVRPKTAEEFNSRQDAGKCDACGGLLKGKSKKIDSGQILCEDCYKHFQ